MSGMNKLKIINFKSISELQIEPAGKSFTLEGRNGAGKTAVIDAVRWALQGNAWINEDVIKKGADKVEVIYSDDALDITRSMKRGKSATIKVTDKTGKVFPSPQKMLDEIVSNLSFDPTDFLELKPADQVKALRELVDPKGEIAKLEDKAKALYDQRRDVGRDVDRLQKSLDTMPKFDIGAGLQEISRTEIMGRYEQAQKIISERERIDRRINETTSEIEIYKDKISKLEVVLDETNKLLAKLPDNPNIDSIKQELDSVDATNAIIRDNQKFKAVETEFKEVESRHKALDTELELTRAKIDTTIKQSELPVDGLAFDADGITLDQKRFSECSDGERLEAALKISMALNKGLKMIAIRNGSLLDADKQAAVMAFAREHGYQVIMEIVGTGDISVEIEQEVGA